MSKTVIPFVAVLAVITAASTAHAQRGRIGDGGRMPETMFPGVQPPPSMPESRMSVPVERYPNTESLSQDRIESEGYHVNGITPQNDGSWQAYGSRDAVPTRPQSVPRAITIFPDGTTQRRLSHVALSGGSPEIQSVTQRQKIAYFMHFHRTSPRVFDSCRAQPAITLRHQVEQ